MIFVSFGNEMTFVLLCFFYKLFEWVVECMYDELRIKENFGDA